MPEVAEVVQRSDGEIVLNDQATALLLGVTADAVRSYAQGAGGRAAGAIPSVVVANGRVRRQEFCQASGIKDADASDVLVHFARLEGVELVFVGVNGERTVVVEGRS